MEHRHGTCSSCGAHYKVPATFAADKAKCKKCGGVVEIGPVEGAAESAPKAEPQAAPRRKPASRPAPSKPAAKKPAARRPAAAAAAAGSDAAPKPVVRKGAASRSGAKRRSKEKPKKKIGALPIVAGVLMLAAVVTAGWLWMNRGDGDAQAAESTDVVPLSPDDPEVEGVETPEDGAEPAAVEGEGEDAAATEGEEAADPFAEAEAKREAAEPDPDSIDLLALADFEPVEGTTDEEWEQMNQWMATFIDPSAGAAGSRAGKKLIAADRKAFPVIVNHYKTLDLATEDGRRMGDVVQRELIQKITSGRNFGWKYGLEPADVLFNKKVVENWWKTWNQIQGNDAGWANLTKREVKKEEPAPAESDELDDF